MNVLCQYRERVVLEGMTCECFCQYRERVVLEGMTCECFVSV